MYCVWSDGHKLHNI